MKFLHSMIRVRNLEKALDFYTRLLGLKLTEERRLDDCTLYFLTDEESGVQVELTYNDETPGDGYVNGNAFGHFAFYCDNLDEFTNKVTSMGYEYLYSLFILIDPSCASIIFFDIFSPSPNPIFLCSLDSDTYSSNTLSYLLRSIPVP